MEEGREFLGRWVSTSPFASDDYLVEYTITKENGLMRIHAVDLQDNEEMEISEVRLEGDVLHFKSLMKSTKRKGVNRFKVKDDKTLYTEFTFTVYETVKRRE
jgi:Tfp pilus assembly ATPase PilU